MKKLTNRFMLSSILLGVFLLAAVACKKSNDDGPKPNKELLGKTFSLVMRNTGIQAFELKSTLTFDENGRFTLYNACQTFTGRYILNAEGEAPYKKILFRDLKVESTCDDIPDPSKFEEHYRILLAETTQYTLGSASYGKETLQLYPADDVTYIGAPGGYFIYINKAAEE